MDNNFSTQVKEIISYSREEALRLGNDFIGAEHLMLGLIRDQENTAIKVLKQLNVNLAELRKEIESFEITNPTRKNISFLLRLSQEQAKKSIAMDDNIEQFSEEGSEFDETKTTKRSKKSTSGERTDRAVELSLLGAIVAMSDIANPTTFLFGAIIALSTMFF